MIEVFEIIHNYYNTGASVKLNFNAVGSTRGNKFKLRKDMCRYDIRKYSCCYLVVNVEKSRSARSDKNTNSCPKTFNKTVNGYIFYHTSKILQTNKKTRKISIFNAIPKTFKEVKFAVDCSALQTTY